MWTEEQAKQLLTLCCSTNLNGELLASELMHEQTLDNLDVFGTRLMETDRKFGISDERPEGLVWPEPKPVIPEGFEACIECDKPTKSVCDECDEPLCSEGMCSQGTDLGVVVCSYCYDELDEEINE